jgi:exodeoxyribonuclease V gamma subunit
MRPVAQAALAVQQAPDAGPASLVPVSLDLSGELRLTGAVPGVCGDRVVRAVYSRLGPKHRLRAWVQVLALAAAVPGRNWTAITIGRGATARPVAATSTLTAPGAVSALQRLGDLVRLRERAAREVLPLPVETAHAYARSRHAGDLPEQALDAAERAWRRERDRDEFLRLCWGGGAPLRVLLAAPAADELAFAAGEDSRLGAYARRLWDPLLAHEQVSLQ